MSQSNARAFDTRLQGFFACIGVLVGAVVLAVVLLALSLPNLAKATGRQAGELVDRAGSVLDSSFTGWATSDCSQNSRKNMAY